MNRRKWIGGAFVCAVVGLFAARPAFCASASAAPATAEKWGMVELAFDGPKEGNPFVDVQLRADFALGKDHLMVRGFYDGDGKYLIRFMPPREGSWRFTTISNNTALDGKKGEVKVAKNSGSNRGPVRVDAVTQFAFADGTPYYPIGTTIYAFPHQPEALQQQTLATLAKAPFNKLRFCVFPKWYSFNKTEPLFAPFEKRSDGKFDLSRPNPTFFRLLDQRIVELQNLGIEVDLILFHPYDEGHWGFDRMGRDADQQYLQYVLARLSAYRNVWWSMANEWDLVKHRSGQDWRDLFAIVAKEDPYKKLCSIHQAGQHFDHSVSPISHISVQTADTGSLYSLAKKYSKPAIDDECEYEGDIEQPWGNISGEELIHRFWQGTIRGGYVGHGETFRTPDEVLWWSKGGVLRGQSPARIAFLRALLEKHGRLVPVEPTAGDWQPYPIAKQGNSFLVYLGRHAPKYLSTDTVRLLEKAEPKLKGAAWKFELIDPWNMTVAPLGRYTKNDRPEMALPSRMFLAVRATPQ